MATALLAVVRLSLTTLPARGLVAVIARFLDVGSEMALCMTASRGAAARVRLRGLSLSGAGRSAAAEQLKMSIGANTTRRRPTAEHSQRNHGQNQADPRYVAKALHENQTDEQGFCEVTSHDIPPKYTCRGMETK